MSLIAFFGALESGLIYGLVALGVLISFRTLDFPDLTADGSFPLGGAVAGISIIAGINPWLACAFGMLAGSVAGIVTAWLHVKLGILQLLASILVMVALYSVNLRIMGAPNLPLLGETTVFSTLVTDGNGYWMTIIGMAISNGLIALAGALFVQTQGGADISIGIGTIVIGLAAVIIGETIIPAKRIWLITFAVVVGAVLYKLFIQVALSSDTLRSIGFGPQDLNLITALLVVLALVLPKAKTKFLSRKVRA